MHLDAPRKRQVFHAVLSSNGSIEVSASDFKKDGQLNSSYPARVTIKSIVENEPFQMILRSKELTDKRDLLEDINPIAW